MDELDRKIIALLQLDGRASNAKIAREVGVSEGTVRRAIAAADQGRCGQGHCSAQPGEAGLMLPLR